MKNPAAHFVRLSSIVILAVAFTYDISSAAAQSSPESTSLDEIGLTELLVKQKSVRSVDEPEWFQSGNFKENGVERVYVQTKPCASLIEAQNALGPVAYRAVLKRMAARIGQFATDELGRKLKIDTAYVFDNLVPQNRNEVSPFKNLYTEEIAQRFGDRYAELFSGYAEIRLDGDFYEIVDGRWDEVQTRGRLISTGIGGVSLLSMLLILFGYLRLNHATHGFYSRRLQMGAGLIALLVILACYGLVAVVN